MNTREFVTPMQRARLIVAITGALALLPPGAAIAQETQAPNQVAQPTTAASPSPTPADRAGSETAPTTEPVIVTANKIEENIQEVPSSISVIDDVYSG